MKKFELKELLEDSELENVSGGVKMRTRIASCVVALLPLCPAIQVEAVSAQMPSQGGASNVSKTQKAKDWIKKNPKKFGAAVLAVAIAGTKIYKNFFTDKNIEEAEPFDVRKYGGDIELRNRSGMTSLMWACKEYGLSDVKYLVKHGIDVNAEDNCGRTALIYAVQSKNFDVVKYLVEEANALVNVKDKSGTNAYSFAIRNGYTEMVDYLSEKCEVATTVSQSDVIAAVASGELDIVKKIVTRDNANIKTKGGKAILQMAIESGKMDIVRYLVDQGANTSLGEWRYAARCNADSGTEILEYLLSKGIDVNAKDIGGKTALMYAAMNGCYRNVVWLLNHGADINIADKKGKTALNMISERANDQNQISIADFLRKYAAK